jgi:uncharacterized protein (UPF0332 family)
MRAEGWLAKAELNLSSASLLLAHGDPGSACNRAYYAMFNAARAALWTVGKMELAMARTHSGMISAFGEHLVKSGKVELAHGRNFGFEAKRRLVSDYEGLEISDEDAQQAIDNAKSFLAAVTSWIATP